MTVQGVAQDLLVAVMAGTAVGSVAGLVGMAILALVHRRHR